MRESNTSRDVFSAVADPNRREILKLLSEGELSVTKLSENFQISRTAVNKHLKILAEAGLVTERKLGRETRYRFIPDPLIDLKDWLGFYEKFWDQKLSLLKQLVEQKD